MSRSPEIRHPAGRIGTALSWWATGVYLAKTGKNTYDRYKEFQQSRDKYAIRISSTEEERLYVVVLEWILDRINPQKIKDYQLVTVYASGQDTVKPLANTKEQQTLSIAGCTVSLVLDQKDPTPDMGYVSIERTLTLRCKSKSDLDIVLDFIKDLYAESVRSMYTDSSEPSNVTFNQYTGSGWTSSEFVSRDKESVILSGDKRDILFDDISNFLNMKSEYHRVNLPWHRGYLFYGPPGTGKSSVSLAVASSFDMSVYFLSLSSVKSDTDLLAAIAKMDKKEAVLILEDIDVVSATHNRESPSEESKGVTLGGLLNVLDGMNTPSGLITIMTTNHPEILDPALIRPGRVDLQMEVGLLDDDQLVRMLQWYLKTDVHDLPRIDSDISPAEITEFVKNNFGFPDKCVQEIRDFISQKNASK